MKKLIFVIFSLFVLTSCSNKVQTTADVRSEIVIHKSEDNTVYIDYINQTNEDIRLRSKLARELKQLDYIVVNRIEEAKYHLILDLMFANHIDKKSTTKNILSNVNLGINIGSHIFKNVGISGAIGTSIGSILGESMDDESFQVVIDVSLEEFLDENKRDMKISDSQIIAEAIINGNKKQIVLDALEDEIVKRVSGFFY